MCGLETKMCRWAPFVKGECIICHVWCVMYDVWSVRVVFGGTENKDYVWCWMLARNNVQITMYSVRWLMIDVGVRDVGWVMIGVRWAMIDCRRAMIDARWSMIDDQLSLLSAETRWRMHARCWMRLGDDGGLSPAQNQSASQRCSRPGSAQERCCRQQNPNKK